MIRVRARARICAGLLCLLSLCLPQSARAVSARSDCGLHVGATVFKSDRFDTVVAARWWRDAIALVGSPRLGTRFLPHDHVLVLDHRAGHHGETVIPVPPYTTPPGLAVSSDNRIVYVAVDATVLELDVATARVIARDRLDVRALGWPAAIATGPNGRLYIVGQPQTKRAPAAVIEALSTRRAGSPRLLWKRALGLTHAGIWVDSAGSRRVVVYMPNAYDSGGTIALLDTRSGTLETSYDAPAAPLAIDSVHNRMYLDDAGSITMRSLSGGRHIATETGSGPLAVNSRYGLTAFLDAGTIVLASAHTLRPRVRIHVSAVTALAFSARGRTLLVGRRSGLTTVNLGRCFGTAPQRAG